MSLITEETSIEKTLEKLEISPRAEQQTYLQGGRDIKKRASDKKKKKKSLGTKKHESNERILFKSFVSSSINFLPETARSLFNESKEVAVYYNEKVYLSGDDDIVYPDLKDDISHISGKSLLDSKQWKLPYMGSDLYKGQEKYGPMPQELLDSPIPCFEYIKKWESKNLDTDYGFERKFTFISPRHHITEIMMTIFESSDNPSLSLICTHLKGGIIVISEDISNKSCTPCGIHSKNSMTRKICYSGFVFEDLVLTENSELTRPFFTIVENKISDSITLLLRCEMDSYNSRTKHYTELKCFSPLKLNIPQHRRKLLKTWIQTGLMPKSDILIGIRDTQTGLLKDLKWFTRNNLYRYFNNPNLPKLKSNFNFNANISVEWLNYCITSITKLVSTHLDIEKLEQPQSFKIRFDKKNNILMQKLGKVPKNVQIAENYT